MRTNTLLHEYIQKLCIKLLGKFNDDKIYQINTNTRYLPEYITIRKIKVIVMNTINENKIYCLSEIIKIYRIYAGILDSYEFYILNSDESSNDAKIINCIQKLYKLQNIFTCSVDISDNKIKKSVIKMFSKGYRWYLRMNVDDFANAVKDLNYEDMEDDPQEFYQRKIRLINIYAEFMEKVFIFKLTRYRRNVR